MLLFCNVGSTGTGKSQFVKNLISKGEKVFIYDFQKEYNLPQYHPKKLAPQMVFFGDFAEFQKIIWTLPKNYTIVAEEATGIFNGRAGQEFIKLVLSKRHHGKNYLLNFHSLKRVPKNILEFCDVLILRKTLDTKETIKTKLDMFPEVVPHFEKINQSKNPYEFKIFYLSNLVR